jgi:alpha-tubulin suppressor-like RCC1 family protein
VSNLCKTQLCSTVQNAVSSVNSTCDATDILFAVYSVDRIEPTTKISKIDFFNLPAASTLPNGHIVFLDDLKVPVISSNGSWIGLDGRTVGTFTENQLWSWGGNCCGQLGDGTITTRFSPVREFCSDTNWCQVSLSRWSSFPAAIKTSGELWAWGNNTCGRIGDGTTIPRISPVREFCSASDWCQVSTGGCHTSAIKSSGQLWAWGVSGYGQLGSGSTAQSCSPIREFCSATDWCQVSASRFNTAAVKISGELWSWGFNGCGQLGNNTAMSGTCVCSPVREISSSTDWCQVSIENQGSIAIKTSGQLWSWGSNDGGILGIGSGGYGTNTCSPVREFCSATDWCQVSTGTNHRVAVKTSGQLWVWGCNNCGQLGDGTVSARCSPVREICSSTDWCQAAAGGLHSAAVKTSGELWLWGGNNCGLLGNGTAISRCSPAREICSAADWCQVSAGCLGTAAIRIATFVCR